MEYAEQGRWGEEGGVCVLILNGGFGRDIFVRPLCNSSPGNYK